MFSAPVALPKTMNDEVHREGVGTEPGRRFLTVLFADLSRSSELAELMETEHYATVLTALRRVYHDTITGHGGAVVRVQGDGLLAIFGYPRTREDDGRRAVRAALEMHQQVRDLRLGLPEGWLLCLHTGIHAGMVLLRSGDVELGRFELLGTVPNIAARLSDAAAAHEILASEETLGPFSRHFITAPPQLLVVKGRAAPLLVYRVDARASAADSMANAARREVTAFVGREAELELLARALDEAVAGRQRSVAVAGAPGMGKTRLIEHFLGRAVQRGCTVLRGYCDSELSAEAMQPFRHMLQSLASQPLSSAPQAIAAHLAAMSGQQTVVLFVDDFQWADNASRGVLAALRRHRRCKVLVVLSTRPSEEAHAAGTAADRTIELLPLNDAQALAVIATRLPNADPFIADEVRRQANGNPLFLEEMCHSAARSGAQRVLGRLGGAGWLNQLVESRVQHLLPPQIELVRVAAVIGNVVPAWLLSTLTGQPADGPAQVGLAEQDLIFPGERAGTLRFKHGITRDIIYESVGLYTRQELHLRIAEALKQHSADDPQAAALEALALHYDAGGNAEQAARYAELAGDRAVAASALDRARALYRVALESLEKLPQTPVVALRWVSVVQRLGRVSVFDPIRAELDLYVRAVDLAERHGSVGDRAHARHWLGYFTYGLGDALGAIDHSERALAEAREAHDEKLAVQILAALGEAHAATARYDQAERLLDEAIPVKRRYRSENHNNVGLAFSLVARAAVLGDRGRFDEAYEAFDEAFAYVAGVTHVIGASILGWRAAVLLWQGRWEAASEAAEESARLAEATHSLTQLSIARAMSAYAAWMTTSDPEHLSSIVEATGWLGPQGSTLFRSFNHGWLAAGLTGAGRYAQARHHAAQALLRSRQHDLLGVPMAYRALARGAVAHRPDRARHYVELAMKAAQQRKSAHEVAVTQLCAAEIAFRQGLTEQARVSLDPATLAFREMSMPWHLGEAIKLRHLLEDLPPMSLASGSTAQANPSAPACQP